MPLLGARFLTGVCSVNNFDYADRASMYEGDTTTVFLQLVDKLKDLPAAGFHPPYRRYTPPASSTLLVTMTSLDDEKVVSRYATQPFPGDASIWSFPVNAADRLRGTVNMVLQLTQPGSVIYSSLIQPGLSVFPKA
jgi:hypothetical protein